MDPYCGNLNEFLKQNLQYVRPLGWARRQRRASLVLCMALGCYGVGGLGFRACGVEGLGFSGIGFRAFWGSGFRDLGPRLTLGPLPRGTLLRLRAHRGLNMEGLGSL